MARDGADQRDRHALGSGESSTTRRVDPKDLRHAPAREDRGERTADRAQELGGNRHVRHTLMEIYSEVERAFEDQTRRVNEAMDNWDHYNGRLGGKQFYNGNSRVFVPLVHDAVNARVVRFSNQLFPQTGRYVEVVTEDGELPHALMALLEHYIEASKLRTEIVPALLRAGDMEGQYSLYVSWRKNTRHVVWRAARPASIPGLADTSALGVNVEDIEDDVLNDEGPHVEIISDADLAVSPATASSLEDALSAGGWVAITRRWSKTRLRRMVDEGELPKAEGEALIKEMAAGEDKSSGRRDVSKYMLEAAGIKRDARGKFALVYEVWTILKLPEGRRLCRAYLAGKTKVASVRRNPLWSDRLPVISAPVRKVVGSFKGDPPVSAVADFQILANDAVNEGMDSAAYALLPIVMTDPEKNPRVGSMIMSLSAIWETSPNDTQFAQFPALWRDALEIVATARQQILQTLGVNPASISQAVGKKKLNQAEIAQEQQIDILVTSDAVTTLENGVLTPLLERIVELDHQYRDEDITIREHGDLGQRARMLRMEPIEFHKKWRFKWFGVEQARSAQQIQQQISAMNVLRGVPPQFYKGYELDLVPAIVHMMESAFGPRIAPLVFKDMRSQLAQDPKSEDELLIVGHSLEAHPTDDHRLHMASHGRVLQSSGDPHGTVRVHMMKHALLMNAQMQQNQQQAQGAQQPRGGGSPGSPGGAGRGLPGQPRLGASPGQQRPGQKPPGSIHIDRLVGTQAPRR